MSIYFSTRDFFRRFPDDAACLAALLRLRRGAAPGCPKCGRGLRPAPLRGAKAFACPRCGHHVYPMAGTAFDGAHLPLQLWFYAAFMAVQARRPPAARMLQRRLGISYPSALRMAHAIAACMAAEAGRAAAEEAEMAALDALLAELPAPRRRRAGGPASASARSSRSKARSSARHIS